MRKSILRIARKRNVVNEVTQIHTASKLKMLQISYDKNETRFLYLLYPEISYTFLVIDIVLLLPLFYFHYLIMVMIKREKKKKGQNLVKNLLACYAVIVPITFFLVSGYVNILTRYDNPPAFISGSWFCVIFEAFGHTSSVYIGGFSIFVAVIKYWFIVHNANARKFGEDKARRLCLALHLVIPIILAALNSVSNGKIDQIFWVDHCWSYKAETEKVRSEKNWSEKLEDLFCLNRQYDVLEHFKGTTNMVMTTSLRAICGGVKVIYLLFLFNIPEIIFYCLIFRYLNR